MTDPDANLRQTWVVRDIIEQAVADWSESWSPLPLPNVIEDVCLGELSGLIERRLVAAGLIDPSTCNDPRGKVA